MCQWGANSIPWQDKRMGLSLAPYVPHNALKPGVEKYPFETADKRFDIDENINRI